MGNQPPKHAFRYSALLLAYLSVVVALTTLPRSVQVIEAVGHLSQISGHPNVTDALGHGALYGSLTAVSYWTLRRRIGFGQALWIALVGAMLLGLTTELLQRFSPGRAVQLSDLLGNWLGAMTMAMLISFRHSTRAGI